MAEGVMTQFLSTIGEFFTQCMTWLADALAVITASPGLTIVVFGTLISGFVVGLLGRLFRVN